MCIIRQNTHEGHSLLHRHVSWMCMMWQERNLLSLPLRLQSDRPASLTKLQVLKRFEFEAQLMRSGVVAVDLEEDSNMALLFVRGAPARIEQLLQGGGLPTDYHQVGLRLQAMWLSAK